MNLPPPPRCLDRTLPLLSALVATATFAVASAPLPATAQQQEDSGAEAEADEGSSEGEESAQSVDSIEDLPTERKKKLLKLVQSARKDYANGQFEKVVSQMKKAYEIYPDPEFLFRIALSHERTGNKQEAVKYYEKYLEEKPDTQKRGRVQRSLGQLREAIREEREEEKEEEQQETAEETDTDTDTDTTSEPNNTLPVVLTSVGGAMTGASVTFGVLNLQTKSTVDSMRNDPRGSGNSVEEFEQKVSEQNLYAGLTIGTGALAAGALTWAVIEWTSSPDGSGNTDDARAARTSGDRPAVDLQLLVGPGSVGVSGDF